jgi:hypothetical protein
VIPTASILSFSVAQILNAHGGYSRPESLLNYILLEKPLIPTQRTQVRISNLIQGVLLKLLVCCQLFLRENIIPFFFFATRKSLRVYLIIKVIWFHETLRHEQVLAFVPYL